MVLLRKWKYKYQVIYIYKGTSKCFPGLATSVCEAPITPGSLTGSFSLFPSAARASQEYPPPQPCTQSPWSPNSVSSLSKQLLVLITQPKCPCGYHLPCSCPKPSQESPRSCKGLWERTLKQVGLALCHISSFTLWVVWGNDLEVSLCMFLLEGSTRPVPQPCQWVLQVHGVGACSVV